MNNFQRALQLRADGKFEEGFQFLKLAVEEDKDVDAIYEYRNVTICGGWGRLRSLEVFPLLSEPPQNNFNKAYKYDLYSAEFKFYLKKAAKEDGNVYAQINLAEIYFHGQPNVHFNEKKAFYWAHLAEKKTKHASAYELLGYMYKKTKDLNLAIKYYKLGALQKNNNCISKLIDIYEDKKDFKNALVYRRIISAYVIGPILQENKKDYNCLYYYGQFHPNHRYIFELVNQSRKNAILCWMLVRRELNMSKDVANIIAKFIFDTGPEIWIKE